MASSSVSSGSGSGSGPKSVWGSLKSGYEAGVPLYLKVIDAYILAVFMTGIVQFAYCMVVGTFPFNAFLAGFISTVGTFVLTVSLRMQVNPQNLADPANSWQSLTLGRVVADWLFANLVLHMTVLNFIG
ncbi:Dolichyl-diphosphooligosaccharide--protein glycosyltransferase subunit DAD1 [Porphyridium purpureum]|uniref:Dolichyl-diphosphooligosaccharide--protein glycosyltransferase subunit OST2 n=1 Tax=Porphyridium purpureum TaxID=35688 RepID=A0A5J4YK33_PORPP|nr:Dolichyl-diphosphooligosaccharide--protein glycosyltransferase subunit DAD1 [Porphyridium purpureum]|eukprot:POR7316..scf244_11